MQAEHPPLSHLITPNSLSAIPLPFSSSSSFTTPIAPQCQPDVTFQSFGSVSATDNQSTDGDKAMDPKMVMIHSNLSVQWDNETLKFQKNASSQAQNNVTTLSSIVEIADQTLLQPNEPAGVMFKPTMQSNSVNMTKKSPNINPLDLECLHFSFKQVVSMGGFSYRTPVTIHNVMPIRINSLLNPSALVLADGTNNNNNTQQPSISTTTTQNDYIYLITYLRDDIDETNGDDSTPQKIIFHPKGGVLPLHQNNDLFSLLTTASFISDLDSLPYRLKSIPELFLISSKLHQLRDEECQRMGGNDRNTPLSTLQHSYYSTIFLSTPRHETVVIQFPLQFDQKTCGYTYEYNHIEEEKGQNDDEENDDNGEEKEEQITQQQQQQQQQPLKSTTTPSIPITQPFHVYYPITLRSTRGDSHQFVSGYDLWTDKDKVLGATIQFFRFQPFLITLTLESPLDPLSAPPQTIVVNNDDGGFLGDGYDDGNVVSDDNGMNDGDNNNNNNNHNFHDDNDTNRSKKSSSSKKSNKTAPVAYTSPISTQQLVVSLISFQYGVLLRTNIPLLASFLHHNDLLNSIDLVNQLMKQNGHETHDSDTDDLFPTSPPSSTPSLQPHNAAIGSKLPLLLSVPSDDSNDQDTAILTTPSSIQLHKRQQFGVILPSPGLIGLIKCMKILPNVDSAHGAVMIVLGLPQGALEVYKNDPLYTSFNSSWTITVNWTHLPLMFAPSLTNTVHTIDESIRFVNFCEKLSQSDKLTLLNNVINSTPIVNENDDSNKNIFQNNRKRRESQKMMDYDHDATNGNDYNDDSEESQEDNNNTTSPSTKITQNPYPSCGRHDLNTSNHDDDINMTPLPILEGGFLFYPNGHFEWFYGIARYTSLISKLSLIKSISNQQQSTVLNRFPFNDSFVDITAMMHSDLDITEGAFNTIIQANLGQYGQYGGPNVNIQRYDGGIDVNLIEKQHNEQTQQLTPNYVFLAQQAQAVPLPLPIIAHPIVSYFSHPLDVAIVVRDYAEIAHEPRFQAKGKRVKGHQFDDFLNRFYNNNTVTPTTTPTTSSSVPPQQRSLKPFLRYTNRYQHSTRFQLDTQTTWLTKTNRDSSVLVDQSQLSLWAYLRSLFNSLHFVTFFDNIKAESVPIGGFNYLGHVQAGFESESDSDDEVVVVPAAASAAAKKQTQTVKSSTSTTMTTTATTTTTTPTTTNPEPTFFLSPGDYLRQSALQITSKTLHTQRNNLTEVKNFNRDDTSSQLSNLSPHKKSLTNQLASFLSGPTPTHIHARISLQWYQNVFTSTTTTIITTPSLSQISTFPPLSTKFIQLFPSLLRLHVHPRHLAAMVAWFGLMAPGDITRIFELSSDYYSPYDSILNHAVNSFPQRDPQVCREAAFITISTIGHQTNLFNQGAKLTLEFAPIQKQLVPILALKFVPLSIFTNFLIATANNLHSKMAFAMSYLHYHSLELVNDHAKLVRRLYQLFQWLNHPKVNGTNELYNNDNTNNTNDKALNHHLDPILLEFDSKNLLHQLSNLYSQATSIDSTSHTFTQTITYILSHTSPGRSTALFLESQARDHLPLSIKSPRGTRPGVGSLNYESFARLSLLMHKLSKQTKIHMAVIKGILRGIELERDDDNGVNRIMNMGQRDGAVTKKNGNNATQLAMDQYKFMKSVQFLQTQSNLSTRSQLSPHLVQNDDEKDGNGVDVVMPGSSLEMSRFMSTNQALFGLKHGFRAQDPQITSALWASYSNNYHQPSIVPPSEQKQLEMGQIDENVDIINTQDNLLAKGNKISPVGQILAHYPAYSPYDAAFVKYVADKARYDTDVVIYTNVYNRWCNNRAKKPRQPLANLTTTPSTSLFNNSIGPIATPPTSIQSNTDPPGIVRQGSADITEMEQISFAPLPMDQLDEFGLPIFTNTNSLNSSFSGGHSPDFAPAQPYGNPVTATLPSTTETTLGMNPFRGSISGFDELNPRQKRRPRNSIKLAQDAFGYASNNDSTDSDEFDKNNNNNEEDEDEDGLPLDESSFDEEDDEYRQYGDMINENDLSDEDEDGLSEEDEDDHQQNDGNDSEEEEFRQSSCPFGGYTSFSQRYDQRFLKKNAKKLKKANRAQQMAERESKRLAQLQFDKPLNQLTYDEQSRFFEHVNDDELGELAVWPFRQPQLPVLVAPPKLLLEDLLVAHMSRFPSDAVTLRHNLTQIEDLYVQNDAYLQAQTRAKTQRLSDSVNSTPSSSINGFNSQEGSIFEFNFGQTSNSTSLISPAVPVSTMGDHDEDFTTASHPHPQQEGEPPTPSFEQDLDTSTDTDLDFIQQYPTREQCIQNYLKLPHLDINNDLYYNQNLEMTLLLGLLWYFPLLTMEDLTTIFQNRPTAHYPTAFEVRDDATMEWPSEMVNSNNQIEEEQKFAPQQHQAESREFRPIGYTPQTKMTRSVMIILLNASKVDYLGCFIHNVVLSQMVNERVGYENKYLSTNPTTLNQLRYIPSKTEISRYILLNLYNHTTNLTGYLDEYQHSHGQINLAMFNSQQLKKNKSLFSSNLNSNIALDTYSSPFTPNQIYRFQPDMPHSPTLPLVLTLITNTVVLTQILSHTLFPFSFSNNSETPSVSTTSSSSNVLNSSINPALFDSDDDNNNHDQSIKHVNKKLKKTSNSRLNSSRLSFGANGISIGFESDDESSSTDDLSEVEVTTTNNKSTHNSPLPPFNPKSYSTHLLSYSNVVTYMNSVIIPEMQPVISQITTQTPIICGHNHCYSSTNDLFVTPNPTQFDQIINKIQKDNDITFTQQELDRTGKKYDNIICFDCQMATIQFFLSQSDIISVFNLFKSYNIKDYIEQLQRRSHPVEFNPPINQTQLQQSQQQKDIFNLSMEDPFADVISQSILSAHPTTVQQQVVLTPMDHAIWEISQCNINVIKSIFYNFLAMLLSRPHLFTQLVSAYPMLYNTSALIKSGTGGVVANSPASPFLQKNQHLAAANNNSSSSISSPHQLSFPENHFIHAFWNPFVLRGEVEAGGDDAVYTKVLFFTALIAFMTQQQLTMPSQMTQSLSKSSSQSPNRGLDDHIIALQQWYGVLSIAKQHLSRHDEMITDLRLAQIRQRSMYIANRSTSVSSVNAAEGPFDLNTTVFLVQQQQQQAGDEAKNVNKNNLNGIANNNNDFVQSALDHSFYGHSLNQKDINSMANNLYNPSTSSLYQSTLSSQGYFDENYLAPAHFDEYWDLIERKQADYESKMTHDDNNSNIKNNDQVLNNSFLSPIKKSSNSSLTLSPSSPSTVVSISKNSLQKLLPLTLDAPQQSPLIPLSYKMELDDEILSFYTNQHVQRRVQVAAQNGQITTFISLSTVPQSLLNGSNNNNNNGVNIPSILESQLALQDNLSSSSSPLTPQKAISPLKLGTPSKSRAKLHQINQERRSSITKPNNTLVKLDPGEVIVEFLPFSRLDCLVLWSFAMKNTNYSIYQTHTTTTTSVSASKITTETIIETLQPLLIDLLDPIKQCALVHFNEQNTMINEFHSNNGEMAVTIAPLFNPRNEVEAEAVADVNTKMTPLKAAAVGGFVRTPARFNNHFNPITPGQTTGNNINGPIVTDVSENDKLLQFITQGNHLNVNAGSTPKKIGIGGNGVGGLQSKFQTQKKKNLNKNAFANLSTPQKTAVNPLYSKSLGELSGFEAPDENDMTGMNILTKVPGTAGRFKLNKGTPIKNTFLQVAPGLNKGDENDFLITQNAAVYGQSGIFNPKTPLKLATQQPQGMHSTTPGGGYSIAGISRPMTPMSMRKFKQTPGKNNNLEPFGNFAQQDDNDMTLVGVDTIRQGDGRVKILVGYDGPNNYYNRFTPAKNSLHGVNNTRDNKMVNSGLASPFTSPSAMSSPVLLSRRLHRLSTRDGLESICNQFGSFYTKFNSISPQFSSILPDLWLFTKIQSQYSIDSDTNVQSNININQLPPIHGVGDNKTKNGNNWKNVVNSGEMELLDNLNIQSSLISAVFNSNDSISNLLGLHIAHQKMKNETEIGVNNLIQQQLQEGQLSVGEIFDNFTNTVMTPQLFTTITTTTTTPITGKNVNVQSRFQSAPDLSIMNTNWSISSSVQLQAILFQDYLGLDIKDNDNGLINKTIKQADAQSPPRRRINFRSSRGSSSTAMGDESSPPINPQPPQQSTKRDSIGKILLSLHRGIVSYNVPLFSQTLTSNIKSEQSTVWCCFVTDTFTDYDDHYAIIAPQKGPNGNTSHCRHCGSSHHYHNTQPIAGLPFDPNEEKQFGYLQFKLSQNIALAARLPEIQNKIYNFYHNTSHPVSPSQGKQNQPLSPQQSSQSGVISPRYTQIVDKNLLETSENSSKPSSLRAHRRHTLNTFTVGQLSNTNLATLPTSPIGQSSDLVNDTPTQLFATDPSKIATQHLDYDVFNNVGTSSVISPRLLLYPLGSQYNPNTPTTKGGKAKSNLKRNSAKATTPSLINSRRIRFNSTQVEQKTSNRGYVVLENQPLTDNTLGHDEDEDYEDDDEEEEEEEEDEDDEWEQKQFAAEQLEAAIELAKATDSLLNDIPDANQPHTFHDLDTHSRHEEVVEETLRSEDYEEEDIEHSKVVVDDEEDDDKVDLDRTMGDISDLEQDQEDEEDEDQEDEHSSGRIYRNGTPVRRIKDINANQDHNEDYNPDMSLLAFNLDESINNGQDGNVEPQRLTPKQRRSVDALIQACNDGNDDLDGSFMMDETLGCNTINTTPTTTTTTDQFDRDITNGNSDDDIDNVTFDQGDMEDDILSTENHLIHPREDVDNFDTFLPSSSHVSTPIRKRIRSKGAPASPIQSRFNLGSTPTISPVIPENNKNKKPLPLNDDDEYLPLTAKQLPSQMVHNNKNKNKTTTGKYTTSIPENKQEDDGLASVVRKSIGSFWSYFSPIKSTPMQKKPQPITPVGVEFTSFNMNDTVDNVNQSNFDLDGDDINDNSPLSSPSKHAQVISQLLSPTLSGAKVVSKRVLLTDGDDNFDNFNPFSDDLSDVEPISPSKSINHSLLLENDEDIENMGEFDEIATNDVNTVNTGNNDDDDDDWLEQPLEPELQKVIQYQLNLSNQQLQQEAIDDEEMQDQEVVPRDDSVDVQDVADQQPTTMDDDDSDIELEEDVVPFTPPKTRTTSVETTVVIKDFVLKDVDEDDEVVISENVDEEVIVSDPQDQEEDAILAQPMVDEEEHVNEEDGQQVPTTPHTSRRTEVTTTVVVKEFVLPAAPSQEEEEAQPLLPVAKPVQEPIQPALRRSNRRKGAEPEQPPVVVIPPPIVEEQEEVEDKNNDDDYIPPLIFEKLPINSRIIDQQAFSLEDPVEEQVQPKRSRRDKKAREQEEEAERLRLEEEQLEEERRLEEIRIQEEEQLRQQEALKAKSETKKTRKLTKKQLKQQQQLQKVESEEEEDLTEKSQRTVKRTTVTTTIVERMFDIDGNEITPEYLEQREKENQQRLAELQEIEKSSSSKISTPSTTDDHDAHNSSILGSVFGFFASPRRNTIQPSALLGNFGTGDGLGDDHGLFDEDDEDVTTRSKSSKRSKPNQRLTRTQRDKLAASSMSMSDDKADESGWETDHEPLLPPPSNTIYINNDSKSFRSIKNSGLSEQDAMDVLGTTKRKQPMSPLAPLVKSHGEHFDKLLQSAPFDASEAVITSAQNDDKNDDDDEEESSTTTKKSKAKKTASTRAKKASPVQTMVDGDEEDDQEEQSVKKTRGTRSTVAKAAPTSTTSSTRSKKTTSAPAKLAMKDEDAEEEPQEQEEVKPKRRGRKAAVVEEPLVEEEEQEEEKPKRRGRKAAAPAVVLVQEEQEDEVEEEEKPTRRGRPARTTTATTSSTTASRSTRAKKAAAAEEDEAEEAGNQEEVEEKSKPTTKTRAVRGTRKAAVIADEEIEEVSKPAPKSRSTKTKKVVEEPVVVEEEPVKVTKSRSTKAKKAVVEQEGDFDEEPQEKPAAKRRGKAAVVSVEEEQQEVVKSAPKRRGKAAVGEAEEEEAPAPVKKGSRTRKA